MKQDIKRVELLLERLEARLFDGNPIFLFPHQSRC